MANWVGSISGPKIKKWKKKQFAYPNWSIRRNEREKTDVLKLDPPLFSFCSGLLDLFLFFRERIKI